MTRAPISAFLGFVLTAGLAATSAAQGKAAYQPTARAVRAAQEISSSEVRISPTAMKTGSTSIDVGEDHWIARGFPLKTLISQAFDVDERLVDIGDDGSTDVRYDVSLKLPREIDQDMMQYMLQGALERKFGIKIAAESKTLDVYVLTAPDGAGSELHRHGMARRAGLAKLVTAQTSGNSDDAGSDDAGQITFFGKNCSGVSSGGIAASAGTIGEFRRSLEPDLDRLLVDETNLAGSYDFKIGNYTNQGELFKLMHDQLGIAVVPAQRKLMVVTVRPTQQMQAAM